MARFLQNQQNEYNFGWDKTQAYIHWHEENARRAAGGTDINTIRNQALKDTQMASMARLSTSVYSGVSLTELGGFKNSINNINQTIADSEAVVNMVLNYVEQAADIGADGLSGHQLAGKISNLIGGVRNSSRKKTLEQLDEVFQLLYDDNLYGVIESLQKNSSRLNMIKKQQLESLLQLAEYAKKTTWDSSDKTGVRNLLVDILTEQGLPDFLQRCADAVNDTATSIFKEIESAQFGKVHIASSKRSGKIDTMLTFILPDGRHVQQGISLKNNWAGYYATILSTSLHASLNYGHNGNQYAMANAISLMDVDTLKAWMEWTNIDRALQGTMQALEDGVFQDRADLLIEFTTNGLQVFNINYIMYHLIQKLKALNGSQRLSTMGFGMTEKYGLGVKQYNRSLFSGANITEMVTERSKYTANWLQATHSVVLDANKLMQNLTT